MADPAPFDLKAFLPYLLNQAADRLSLTFQRHYKDRYGMLRGEWRVLANLGCYGPMTARQICDKTRMNKTKVSRAVAALERKRYLTRREIPEDRRQAVLNLTGQGQAVHDDLARAAAEFDAQIGSGLSQEEARILRNCLTRLAGL